MPAKQYGRRRRNDSRDPVNAVRKRSETEEVISLEDIRMLDMKKQVKEVDTRKTPDYLTQPVAKTLPKLPLPFSLAPWQKTSGQQ